MRWYDLDPDRGVLELDGSPSSTARVGAEIELLIWWGGGERTRGLWLHSQTGRALGWATVGEA